MAYRSHVAHLDDVVLVAGEDIRVASLLRLIVRDAVAIDGVADASCKVTAYQLQSTSPIFHLVTLNILEIPASLIFFTDFLLLKKILFFTE